MPRIKLNEQNLVGGSLGFAQADPSASVGAARELQQIGRSLQNIGFDTMNRIQTAEDSQNASEVQSESVREFSNWSMEDEQKNGIEGKSQRAASWWEKRRLEDEKKLGSFRSITMYRERIQSNIQKTLYDIEVTERVKRIEKLQEGLKTESDDYSKSLISEPDPDQVFINDTNYRDRLKKAVEAGVVFKDQEEILSKENMNKMTVSMFEGFLQKDEKSVRAGAALLDGKDERSKAFIKALTPDQFKSLSARFESKIREQNKISLAEQRRTLSDIVTELKMGGDVDIASGDRIMSFIKNNPESKKEDTARMANEWRAAKVLNQSVRQAKMASPAEMAQIRKEFESSIRGKDKTFGATSEVEMIRAFESSIGQMQMIKEQDPFAYVFTNDNQMQSLASDNRHEAQQMMIERGVELQRKIGIPSNKIRVSSPKETELFAMQITTLNDPAQMESVFAQYQQKYGPYARKFFQEVSSDKNGVGDMAVVGMLSDQTSRRSVLSNILRKDEVESAFKNNPTLSSAKKEIKAEVESQSQDMFSSFVAGNYSKSSLGTANALKKAVELEAMSMMATGKSPANKPKEAVQKAYDNIINRNFEFESTGRSSVYLKRGSNVRMDDVIEFINRSTTKEGFEALNPWGDLEYNKAVFKTDDKQERENTLNNLKKYHRWVVNDTDDGLRLVIDRNNQPVFATTIVEEKTPDGKKIKVRKPIEVSFADINKKIVEFSVKTDQIRQVNKLKDPFRIVGRRGFGEVITVKELSEMSNLEAESLGLLSEKKKIMEAQ